MLAFLDISPQVCGDLLLIPKEHYERMPDVPDNLIKDMFLRAKHLMQPLKNALEADPIALVIWGMDVLHFHIHLIRAIRMMRYIFLLQPNTKVLRK